MLEEDPDAFRKEHILILNSGVQYLLNKCFKAEETVSRYSERLQFIPTDSTDEPGQELLSLRAECIQRNLAIVSGDVARETLVIYCVFSILMRWFGQSGGLTCKAGTTVVST